MSELASARKTRSKATLAHLDDDELRVHAEQVHQEAERTIEEWRDFVAGGEWALRSMGGGSWRDRWLSKSLGGFAS